MLAVTVDLHREVVTVLEGEPVTGLHGTPDPEVERKAENVGAPVSGDSCGPIGRAVVDDDDVEAGIERANLVDHAPN